MTERMSQQDVSRAVLAALAQRSASATVCPSEVARSLAGSDTEEWRDLMPIVHEAVDELLECGAIELSWKGTPLPVRSGPYRISRSKSDRD
jgi:hypothetical protein